eukprot:scaffold300_cov258-Pinguiococcus_pyrenoidosus.AAC.1
MSEGITITDLCCPIHSDYFLVTIPCRWREKKRFLSCVAPNCKVTAIDVSKESIICGVCLDTIQEFAYRKAKSLVHGKCFGKELCAAAPAAPIVASRVSNCPVCLQPVLVGDWILRVVGGWAHSRCSWQLKQSAVASDSRSTKRARSPSPESNDKESAAEKQQPESEEEYITIKKWKPKEDILSSDDEEDDLFLRK